LRLRFGLSEGEEETLVYPEGLRSAAFGDAAAISAEGDAEGEVLRGTGPNEMIYDGKQQLLPKQGDLN
jgi:hypothetical protein